MPVVNHANAPDPRYSSVPSEPDQRLEDRIDKTDDTYPATRKARSHHPYRRGEGHVINRTVGI